MILSLFKPTLNLDFRLKFFWGGGQHFSQLIQCDTQPPCRPPVQDWPSGKSHHSWRRLAEEMEGVELNQM